MSARWEDTISGDMALVAGEVSQGLSVQAVIHRYHDSLLRFLKQRLRISEDAADVAQETYIRLMQYEGSREIHSASALLFRIAINVAHDLGRSEQARRMSNHYPIDDLDIASDQPTPEREVAAAQDLELLFAAIDKLPPKCQQVFLLSRARRMTYPEIAAHCSISVKMVEKHISHALKICASQVGGYRNRPS